MHELAFADAARPTPVVILKLPLLEYSLGHELLLLRWRNPLLLVSPAQFNALPMEQQCLALTQAVWICCNTWEENERQPLVWLKLKIWKFRTRAENFALAIAEFRNYLAESRTIPSGPDKEADAIANGEKDDSGRELGAPLLANLYGFVIHNSKFKIQNSVWNHSYGLAAWLYFADLESDGRMRIENRKEAEIRTEMAEHRAAIEAEEKLQAASSKLQDSKNLATAVPDLGTDETEATCQE